MKGTTYADTPAQTGPAQLRGRRKGLSVTTRYFLVHCYAMTHREARRCREPQSIVKVTHVLRRRAFGPNIVLTVGHKPNVQSVVRSPPLEHVVHLCTAALSNARVVPYTD